MKLIETIASNMDEYTKTEKKIATYIINNVLEFTLSTIGSVADELEVSKTSLIRFAKRMGFDGYIEFRKKLQEEEVMRFTPAERFRRLVDNKYLSNAEKMEYKEIDSIRQCFANISGASFDRLLRSITSAKQVYTAGFDMASFLAEILSYRMKTFGFPFEYLDASRSAFPQRLMFATPEDLLIVFDFPDYSDYCLDAILYAKEKGMTVALITDYVTCPLAKYTDLSFYCDSQTDIFKNSLMAPLFFINLLMSAAVYQSNEKMIEFLKRREETKKFEQSKKHD